MPAHVCPVVECGMSETQRPSLYRRLGERAPEPVMAGQTIETATKETLDNDQERLNGFLLREYGLLGPPEHPSAVDGHASSDHRARSLYRILGTPAPTSGPGDQTTYTFTKETIDNDQERLGRGLLAHGP